MGKKWIEALVQDVQKVELQKERKNSYTIYDPKGVGADKVKSIMLMLTDGEGIGNLNPVQQKKESFYTVVLYWQESQINIFEETYTGLDDANKKYNAIKNRLEKLHEETKNDDPEIAKKSSEFMEYLKTTETKPPTEVLTAPITTTQATYRNFPVTLINVMGNMAMIEDKSGVGFFVPKEMVKVAQVQKDTNITLESGEFGWDYIIRHDDGRTKLIQTDYDYPGVASSFGWSGEQTDIAGAQKYLDENIGKKADDPGYFD